MEGNKVCSLETRPTGGPTGPVIMVAVNLYDVTSADAFVGEVVQKVLMQRMVSPPDTRMLCISLMGPLSSRTFANLWHRHVQADQAMAAFMGMMTVADVIHGTPQGQVLDQTSLLAPSADAAPGPGGATPPGGGGLLSKARSLFGGKRQ